MNSFGLDHDRCYLICVVGCFVCLFWLVVCATCSAGYVVVLRWFSLLETLFECGYLFYGRGHFVDWILLVYVGWLGGLFLGLGLDLVFVLRYGFVSGMLYDCMCVYVGFGQA